MKTIKTDSVDLFGNPMVFSEGKEIGERTKSGTLVNNPMIRAHGGTLGQRCKNCIHLVAKRFAKTYYKCELRGNVDKCSPVSDHKFNWPACGKFEKIEETELTLKQP